MVCRPETRIAVVWVIIMIDSQEKVETCIEHNDDNECFGCVSFVSLPWCICSKSIYYVSLRLTVLVESATKFVSYSSCQIV
jgi:hypothetical protein